MSRTLGAVIAALAVAAGAAHAQTASTPGHTVTGNVGLWSQYVFRGLTQTDKRPALQGGFDYAHASGVYAGLWGSNISWISDFNPAVSASLELDAYLGYKHALADDWSYDLGYLRYNYPGSYHGATKADTDELYAALSWKWLTLKLSYSLGDTFGVAGARGTTYADLSAAIPLPHDLTLNLHAGRQAYRGSVAGVSNDQYSYSDWRAELAWAFAKDWAAGAGFTHTNAREATYTPVGTGRFTGGSLGYAFVKKSF